MLFIFGCKNLRFYKKFPLGPSPQWLHKYIFIRNLNPWNLYKITTSYIYDITLVFAPVKDTRHLDVIVQDFQLNEHFRHARVSFCKTLREKYMLQNMAKWNIKNMVNWNKVSCETFRSLRIKKSGNAVRRLHNSVSAFDDSIHSL